jgi:hypothetical protein
MLKTITSTTIFCLFLLIAFFGWRHGWFDKPALAPQAVYSVEIKVCLQTALYEDNYGDIDKYGVAAAHINLARETGKNICELVQTGAPMAPPSVGRNTVAGVAYTRKAWFVEMKASTTSEGRAQWAEADIIAEAALNNPAKFFDYDKYSWLKCVDHYVRAQHVGSAGTDVGTMQAQMKLVFTSKTGAMFFCPR